MPISHRVCSTWRAKQTNDYAANSKDNKNFTAGGSDRDRRAAMPDAGICGYHKRGCIHYRRNKTGRPDRERPIETGAEAPGPGQKEATGEGGAEAPGPGQKEAPGEGGAEAPGPGQKEATGEG